MPREEGMAKMERLGCLYLTFLNHPQGLTFEKIREQLPLAYTGDSETARRKFERDKDDLRAIGMELEHFPDGAPLPGGGMARGHVYIPRSDLERLPDLKLTPEETTTLATLLLYALEDARDERSRELLRSAASKLFFRSPLLLGSGPKDFWTPARAKPDEKLALMRKAIQKRQVLELEYPDRGGGTAVRKIRPRGLISHRGRWCLVSHTQDGMALRYFYVDRVIQVRPGKGSFPPDPAFNIKEHSLHPLLLKIHDPVEVVMEAGPEHLETLSDFTAAAGAVVRGRRITFRTANLPAVFSFLLRHPGAAEALGPAGVHAEFQKYLSEIEELYK